MRAKPELLIPASSLEVLKIAVIFGADAVYIGGEAFGLRAKARNFSMEDMKEGIEFAHQHHVKVYVTANILAHNKDLDGVREYFRELKEIRPDALIISDPGVFMIAKEVCPEIERHISTQANNTNYETYKFWYGLGAKRVVSARELSLEEIKQAFLNAPMENVADIVICGFGEPTMRLDDLVKLLTFIHQTYPKFKVRMNTNGLSDLEYGKKTAMLFKGLLNTISISLNESNAEKYLEVTRSRFGIKSYKAMLDFAVDCKNYIPNVVVTIVDIIGEDEINACKKVCEEYSLNLRIRRYEAN